MAFNGAENLRPKRPPPPPAPPPIRYIMEGDPFGLFDNFMLSLIPLALGVAIGFNINGAIV